MPLTLTPDTKTRVKACAHPDCSSAAYSLGWCRKHYERVKRHGDPDTIGKSGCPRRQYVACAVDGCHGNVKAREWCAMHYARWVRSGVLETTIHRGDPESRFWEGLDSSASAEACWLWHGAADQHGYGFVWNAGKLVRAHRFAYELLVGPIPPGAHLHHRCETPACCNPAHLEPLTPGDHKRHHGASGTAGANAAKTHCLRGHELVGANLYVHDGHRSCRACAALRARQRYAAKKVTA